MQYYKIWRHFDVLLLAAVAIMSIAGVAIIRSAIAGNETLLGLPSRQALFSVAGFAVVILLAAIDYRIWSSLTRLIYAVTVVLLGGISAAGIAGFGAQRWFQVGTLFLQPSEIAKVGMILVLANFFDRNKDSLNRTGTIVRSLLWMGLPAALIFIQPDLSTTITLGVIWLSMVWAVGVPIKTLLRLVGILLIFFLILSPFIANYFINGYPQGEDFGLIKNYQMDRIVNFLFPDPEASFGETYNIIQARIAIGNGGWFGKGYGSGTQVQLRFLKVRHTDFIFAAISEEFGFVGATIFILLLMFIIVRILRAARLARDTYGALICYSVAALFLFQGSFNIGMNLNLFPVSGLPLPFLSYGGSSLLGSLLSIGLVESVILRHKKIEL